MNPLRGVVVRTLGKNRRWNTTTTTTASESEEAQYALQQIDNIREEVEGFGEAGKDDRDDILLYEPKPLYIVRNSKQFTGAMLYRDLVQASMWGLPNRFRDQKGFLQRGRLHDLNAMVDKVYDVDFQELSGGYFMDEVMKFKNQPMLRPKMPSLLNPQFARTLLKYFMKQMERLNMKRLIIYEVWGHNGQTALSLLDILEEEHPHIYATCEYHMIDVLGVWMTHRDSHIKAHHYDHYFEHHISFFEWEVIVPDRVFFLCLEVLSYLPYDRVDVLQTGHTMDSVEIFELCRQEVTHTDDRMEYHSVQMYTKYDWKDWYRPLQDELILKYLSHVDFGYFTKEVLEQHRYRLGLYNKKSDDGLVGDNDASKMFRHDLTEKPGTFSSSFLYYHNLGMLNNQFWIPSTLVSFFDVLRKNFPRHIFVCLDQTDNHTYIPGVNAPSLWQYALGQRFDVKHTHLHEGMLGVTEMRQNLNMTHVRKLYYDMMELPPEHPLHLRCMNLRSFFETYGTEEVREGISVTQSAGVTQPMDLFLGGKLLVSEFGADLEDIQDLPIDVASSKGHFRQRFFNSVCKYATKVGLLDEQSPWYLSSEKVGADPKQVIDPTPVRDAIGPNPSHLELDKPIGYDINVKRTYVSS